jgi:uncharacterized membrane protein HdeD (DUF308 family)
MPLERFRTWGFVLPDVVESPFVKDVLTHFKAWPLLLAGVVLVIVGTGLAESDGDPSDARALTLGVGCVLVGAGIARVIYDDFHRSHRDCSSEETDHDA